MYLGFIRYTFMDVNVTTVEAPKGNGTKGMVDFIQNGVKFHGF